MAWAVLAGERGPVRDIVVLNATAALVATDDTPPAERLTEALRDGYTAPRRPSTPAAPPPRTDPAGASAEARRRPPASGRVAWVLIAYVPY